MIKVNCWDRCDSNKKAVAAIDSFNEKFYDYLNRAVAGENPYELEIDKKWANFIYQSSKMTFMKALAVLIAIAPSFTKYVSVLTTPFVIKGCYLEKNPNTALALGECLKYNNDSPFAKIKWTPEAVIFIIGLTFLFLMPHYYFVWMLRRRFQSNKLTFWISAAKIQLSTLQKRLLTCDYYYFMIVLVFTIGFVCKKCAEFNEEFGTQFLFPKDNNINVIFTFEKTDPTSPLVLLSSALVYLCLLTVTFAQIRQPFSFFIGFRDYLKAASRVPYNIATVDYRIEIDPVTWKFIERYYRECERYERRIVLIAMTTHLLDLELLEAEGSESNQSRVSIKVE